MIEWKRPKDSYVESKCGRYQISPLYFSCVNPRGYQLKRGDHVVAWQCETQREAKKAADLDAAKLEAAKPKPPYVKPPPYVRPLRVRCACSFKRMFTVGESFRGRKLDVKKPVQVYRNLQRRDGVWYSVRQGGLVVAHTRGIMLSGAKDCRFVVQQAGRRRALATGRRNVHAWVRGKVVCSAYGTDVEREDENIAKGYPGKLAAWVRYDRERGAFTSTVTSPPCVVTTAGGVLLNVNGCSYAY